MTDPVQNIAQTILDNLGRAAAVQPLVSPDLVPMPPGPLDHPAHHTVAVPEGMQIRDLTADLDKVATKLQPWRRTGTAKLTDLDSLIAWVNRHKGPTSALFANTGPQPGLTCIADYLGAGAPVIDPITRDPGASHMLHRAHYAFPLSPEWKTWKAISGQPMTGPELGEFIEANAKDLLEPTSYLLGDYAGDRDVERWEEQMRDLARRMGRRFGQYATLAQLARGFQINEVSNVSTSMNRDTGENTIQFLNEHQQPDGSPVSVPNLFLIAIPVFEEGAHYRIVVRFHYRKAGAAVRFFFTLHDADVCFRDAVTEALDRAATETALPLFRGEPEKAA